MAKNMQLSVSMLSLVCSAVGANLSEASNNDFNRAVSTEGGDNYQIYKQPSDEKNIKVAKLYIIGAVGGAVAGGGVVDDNCYSNCYSAPLTAEEICINNGYSATPCVEGYTVSSSCPEDASYKKCSCHTECHTESVADQCAELSPSYTITSCSVGYSLTNKCPVSGATQYEECSCHNTAEICIDKGYANTSCDTGYALSGQCPDNSSYYSTCSCYTNCHSESVADQCAEFSPAYDKTSCASGYSLTDQCPISGGEAYYISCTCHTDTAQQCVDDNYVCPSAGCCDDAPCSANSFEIVPTCQYGHLEPDTTLQCPYNSDYYKTKIVTDTSTACNFGSY